LIKGFKIRIYPTKDQEQMLWRHIGACRFIWNLMLDLQQKQHELGGRFLSAFDMINMLPIIKQDEDYCWLRDVSSRSLSNECRDVSKAYERFFKKISGLPKFKSRKRSKPAYSVRETIWFQSGMVSIERIGKVKYKTDFELPQGTGHKFGNVRISMKNGKWFLSFCMECENQAPQLTDKVMGIDLGVKDLATVAIDDEQLVFGNINKSRKMRFLEKQIRHLRRTISRKYEANRVGRRYVKTNNILRCEDKLHRLLARQTDIRSNYIHQTTHKLVSMLPMRITMEDLNVQGMMKNRHLSKAVQQQCFYEFRRQMQYKCEWASIELIFADRFYPSSKTCSCCGNVKHDLKLSDRTYTCSCCGAVIDRDYNAAINLMRYAA